MTGAAPRRGGESAEGDHRRDRGLSLLCSHALSSVVSRGTGWPVCCPTQDGEVSFAALSNLPYLQAVFYETLRCCGLSVLGYGLSAVGFDCSWAACSRMLAPASRPVPVLVLVEVWEEC